MPVVVSKSLDDMAAIVDRLTSDMRLGFDELGLLLYLLNQTNGAEFTVADLSRSRGRGRDWMYKRLTNLRALGYVETVRCRNTQGQMAELLYKVSDTCGHGVGVCS